MAILFISFCDLSSSSLCRTRLEWTCYNRTWVDKRGRADIITNNVCIKRTVLRDMSRPIESSQRTRSKHWHMQQLIESRDIFIHDSFVIDRPRTDRLCGWITDEFEYIIRASLSLYDVTQSSHSGTSHLHFFLYLFLFFFRNEREEKKLHQQICPCVHSILLPIFPSLVSVDELHWKIQPQFSTSCVSVCGWIYHQRRLV